MIKPVNLQELHSPIQQELEEAVLRVLRSAAYCLGPDVDSFEKEFAEYCQSEFCIGVNSGTSALHLALLSAGVGTGDEVISSPFSFIASSASIRYCQARPVYVDIDPETYLMDTSLVREALTDRTKAIMPVHLYGQIVDMAPLQQLAREHGLKMIEDAAQAHGAERDGKRAGQFGDLACFSFYPTKNLGACGEGGAIVTNEASHDKMTRSLRSWGTGQPGNYDHALEGFNYRLEGIQGAVLSVKLKYLESWIEKRRANADLYRQILSSNTDLVLPLEEKTCRHVYHQFTVRVPDRARVIAALRQKGIIVGSFYPIPIHLQQAYEDLGYKEGQFPHAEKAAAEVIQLPVGPELKTVEIESVAESLTEVI
ncbi:MAG: DegT/DnrJ/EryC1/StrS family aminotransferase [Verrucomicrobiota bacterium]